MISCIRIETIKKNKKKCQISDTFFILTSYPGAGLFLFDIGVVPTDEPFYRLRNQGLVLAHAFQRQNGWLVANDLVEERDWKFFEIETGLEVDRIISKINR